ncbi:MAG TPA: RNA polymerase subunit sigma-70 [Clostridiales bacterium]|nr:RNA polymerase subunit sigma-70 [Clostridiales bacterium]
MNSIKTEEQIAEHVLKYKERYYRLAYSYVKNADDAMDIVQESVYKAISSVNSLKNPDFLKTWFYRILVNTSIDFVRRKQGITIMDEESLLVMDKGSDDNYENFDLKSALDNLPEKYRTVVLLRYFEDLKLEEIAEILNENINTIKTRLYKSLEILRVKMEDYKEV